MEVARFHARLERVLTAATEAVRLLIRLNYLPEARILWEYNLQRLERNPPTREYIRLYRRVARFAEVAREGSLIPIGQDTYAAYTRNARERLTLTQLLMLEDITRRILTLTRA